MSIYEFAWVPFGPTTATSWCQQLMVGVALVGVLHLTCYIYLNDCIVYSKTKEIFLTRLSLFKIEYVERVINFNGTPIRNETISKA